MIIIVWLFNYLFLLLFGVSLLPLLPLVVPLAPNWTAHIFGLLARPVFKYSILHRPWFFPELLYGALDE